MASKLGGQKAQVWMKRVAAFERSGLSRRAWCGRQGLNASTLDYWRRQLGERAVPELVPIVVSGGVVTADIEIALPGGTRVRVPGTVDAVWLSALLRGIGGC